MVARKRGLQKKLSQASALQQVNALFDAAALAFSKDAAEAHRLVAQAHRLVLRSRLRIPLALKRRYCKACRSLWVPGATVRVRLSDGKVVYTCLRCRQIRRIPLK